MAFGETAGGVEAATVQQAAVEALDESSSDVELEPKEMKVRRKSRKLRRWKTTRIGMVDRKEWMLLSNLKKLPSALKQETDRLRGDKNDQVLYFGSLITMGLSQRCLIEGDISSARNDSVAAS